MHLSSCNYKILLKKIGPIPALSSCIRRLAKSASLPSRSMSSTVSVGAAASAKTAIESQLLKSTRLFVRHAEEFKLHLSLAYPQPLASGQQQPLQPHPFNFNRAKEEIASVTLARIQASINNHLESRMRSKLKRKQRRQQDKEPRDSSEQSDEQNNGANSELSSHPCYVRDLAILDSAGNPLDTNTALCGDAFCSGHTLSLNSGLITYQMLVDPCLILCCKLTSQLLSGFPLHCDLQLESCSECERIWELSSSLTKPNWTEFSRSRCPTLPVDSADCFVRLTAVPPDGGLQFQQTFGPVANALNSYVSTRHAFTPAVTASDTVRVVSYNLLANLYADSDYSRNQLFPWCDPNYLSMSYRKCLIFRELSGYNADLVALQEVDEPLFRSGGLAEFLEHECGLSGLSQMKLGQDGKPAQEGLALFYRTSRFDLAEDRSLPSLNQYLDSTESLAPLSSAVKANEKFLETWQARGQCAQVLILRCRDSPGRYLCACTTHLFWYPSANLVRLLQTHLVLHHLDQIKREYSARGDQLAIVLAGDFNSMPDRGPYWLTTRGHLAAEHADWFSPGREAMIDRQQLSHSLSLAAAYEPQPFTNYTGGFSGHLDHIFFDTELLKLQGTVPLPRLEDIHPLTALPNRCYPSDHLALIADLMWL
ncbi:hypothetical protein BOX15_Mlig012203g1 [Macrostomum lignano]|uniref:Endonuclease/exonuclease/phosphatase domain-containing protein n=2 Tax=Macrostomum lignano TaxID=282301 RepID=A0A267GM83_9PLAT|nr:hypothetical protein BOX15_Mlig012203g1 [Macrostomum lignano]